MGRTVHPSTSRARRRHVVATLGTGKGSCSFLLSGSRGFHPHFSCPIHSNHQGKSWKLIATNNNHLDPHNTKIISLYMNQIIQFNIETWAQIEINLTLMKSPQPSLQSLLKSPYQVFSKDHYGRRERGSRLGREKRVWRVVWAQQVKNSTNHIHTHTLMCCPIPNG